ncbi:12253_t:CDS:2 [Entrophospora sp. SA101]|nr:12253_t:CDS:2 [Entrophospora sp. SA101]
MLEISFARSSGPGGQNVNKLNTKVDIRINLDKAYWIPEYARNKIKIQESNHINKKGELVLVSQLTRTQSRNIEDCIDKLITTLIDCIDYRIGSHEYNPFSGDLNLNQYWLSMSQQFLFSRVALDYIGFLYQVVVVMYRSLLKLNYDDAETQKKKVIEIMISKSENLH